MAIRSIFASPASVHSLLRGCQGPRIRQPPPESRHVDADDRETFPAANRIAPMKPAESPAALKLQATLGDKFEVLEFDASTRTAADAAAAIGCEVAQIAKSLIFRGATSGQAVVIIASGRARREKKKSGGEVGGAYRSPGPRFRAGGAGLRHRRRAAGRPQSQADR